MYKVHEFINDLVSSHLPVKCKGATILGSLVLMEGVRAHIAPANMGLGNKEVRVVTEKGECLGERGELEQWVQQVATFFVAVLQCSGLRWTPVVA